jgi:putative ABC transport system permease protein
MSALPTGSPVFLAPRELRFARGRFLLIGGVVGLIATLSVILTGLSTGLVDDNVSGVRALPVTHLAFEGGARDPSFSRSTVEAGAWRALADAPGVEAAAPYGNQLVHMTSARGAELDIALFGVEPGSFLAPRPVAGRALGRDDGVLVSQKVLDEGVRVGDELVVDRVGTRLPVVGAIGDESFGHVAVAYAPLRTWQRVHYGLPGTPPAEAFEQATAVGLRLAPGADTRALDRGAGTHTISKSEAFHASPGYSAETSTMLLIRSFLYLISALVVGAFFFVWTVQRRPEIALVKALGAPSGYLVRDALVQVLVVLVGATAAGVLAGVGLGALIGGGVPFALRTGPVALSAVLLVVLGVAGAVWAVRRIARVDPVLALGAAR